MGVRELRLRASRGGGLPFNHESEGNVGNMSGAQDTLHTTAPRLAVDSTKQIRKWNFITRGLGFFNDSSLPQCTRAGAAENRPAAYQ